MLGPVLINLCINELELRLSDEEPMVAGATELFRMVETGWTVTMSKSISERETVWQMPQLNATKCKVTHVGQPPILKHRLEGLSLLRLRGERSWDRTG